ncbi:MAG: M16 family metallopeptidase [Parvularculaceae bacterium]
MPAFAFLAAFFLFIASAAAAADVDLPYEEFRLDNGLRVVVHEDRKAPIVAVADWYRVGSKDEPAGKTGFAHLFEHLMFNGSENYDDEWFKALQEVGATGVNGTTSFDRTNYFATVPTPALERLLWLESDRMGHLLGAVTQDKLDEQRGVVANEKRQGDNRPYGRAYYSVLNGLLPAGHPYAHATIGSLEDLDAASLDDVRAWFEKYYGAANATLVLAGDIDAAAARLLAEKYFAHIPAGPPLTRMTANAPTLDVDKREIMYDDVPQAQLDRNWVAPGRTTRQSLLLTLAADVLGGGKTSRLYRRLVYDLELATSASAGHQPQELMGFFSWTLDAKPDATEEDLATLEAEAEAVVEDFLARGPSKAELQRAKTAIEASVVRSLEQVSGKASRLASGAVYADDPAFILTQLKWLPEATPIEVRDAARAVMSEGHYQLNVLPYADHATTSAAVDRSAGLPPPPAAPDLTFPEVQETSLSNGVPVVFARRAAVPVVRVSVQFDAGYAADGAEGGKLGLASFAGAMLDEGAGRRTALEIAETIEGLGATLGAGSSLDTTTVGASSLTGEIDATLDVLADVVRRPTFDQTEIDKLRRRWLAGIAQEKASPYALALRLLPPQIYGEDHAYGVPFTGSGTEESIGSITREDLLAFHTAWIRPDNARIFVVGDTTLDAIKPKLEAAFGDWRAPATPTPAKNVAEIARAERGKLIVVDKPGAPQSFILAGHVAPPTGAPNAVAIDATNEVLGGGSTARIYNNLREDKGWSYGAYTFLASARGQRPFLVNAPVQTDKTADAIRELLAEMRAYRGERPAQQDELDRAVADAVRSLPGAYETAASVLSSLQSSAVYGRPWDYPTTLKPKYEALTPGRLAETADEVVHPDSLVWVVVGDRAKIEADLSSLDLGPMENLSLGSL